MADNEIWSHQSIVVKIAQNAVQSWEVRCQIAQWQETLFTRAETKTCTSRHSFAIQLHSQSALFQRSPMQFQVTKREDAPLSTPSMTKTLQHPKASKTYEDSWVITYTNAHSWEMVRLRKHCSDVRNFNICIIIIFFYAPHSDRFLSRKFASRSSGRVRSGAVKDLCVCAQMHISCGYRWRYDCCVVDQCLQTARCTQGRLLILYINVDECKNPHLWLQTREREKPLG